jgi:hypothetical protein
MAGALAGAMIVGCSDDASTTRKPIDSGKKGSAAQGNTPSTAKGSQDAPVTPDPTAKPSESTDNLEPPATAKSGPTSDKLPEPSPEPSATPKDQAPPEPKPEPKSEPKPEVKPEPKPEPKAEAKPEPKPEAKPEPKPVEGKVEVKAEPDPTPKSDAKPAAKDESKPTAKEEPKADAKPASKAEPKPEAKPDTAKQATPTSTSGASDATPKFSTFASADDLSAEVKFLVDDLEKAVADEDEYKSQVEGRFIRDGNTLTLIAIALGLHDQECSLKPQAKAVAAAARKLAATKDYQSTKQAVQGLKAAAEGKGSGDETLKWGKVSPLIGLMKDEVPSINNKLKTSLRRFKQKSAATAAHAATMALIAENAMLYVADTKKPDEGKKWTEFAAQMRSTAMELAAKAHAKDETGAKAAMDKLDQSCHDCHAVFNPEKAGASEKSSNE